MSRSATATSRVASIIGVSCLATAALLTLVVVLADGPTPVDDTVSSWVAVHRSAWVISVMEVVTIAGSATAIWLVGAGCALWGASRHGWRPFWFVIPTALVASLATNLVKLAIARPRPGDDIALRHFSGWSFPSGHTTTAAALWGALAVVLVCSGRVRTRTAIAAWLAVTVGVAVSRVLLGAHWTTDVLAGAAVGAGCVAVAVLVAAPSGRASSAEDGDDRTERGEADGEAGGSRDGQGCGSG